MRVNRIVSMMSALALLLLPLWAVAQTTYLEADFDDKPLDTPIGTGGAENGEPVEVDHMIIATVRGAPMASPSLEIQDNDDYAAGVVYFEFLGSEEITSGLVAISCDLWFPEMSPGYNFFIYIREQGSSAESFTNVYFYDDGTVSSFDADSNNGTIGSWEAGRMIPFAIIFDMALGTYRIWLDGEQILADETHGITEHGVGAVLFGCDSDSDLAGAFYVDNILVSDTPGVPTQSRSWGQVKALYSF